MKRAFLPGGLCLVLLAVICIPALGAAADDLQRAIDLYKAHDYVHAQDLLRSLSISNLTDAQLAVWSDYLARTQQALASHVGSVRTPTSPEALTSGNLQQPQRLHSQGQVASPQPQTQATPTRQRSTPGVGEISFGPGTTFNDAIERISRGSGVNIFVNWPALQLVGVTPEQEVTLPRLRGVTWRKVLDLVLQQVNATLGQPGLLDWAIDSGVLTISTSQDLSSQLFLRVYDVGDLLVPRLVVPRGAGMQLSTGMGGIGTGTGTGTGGGAVGTGTGGFTGGNIGTVP